MMIRAADLLAEGRRIPGMAGGVDGRPRLGTGGRAASGRRPPTTGTTRWPWSASRARAAGSCGAGAASTAPDRVVVGDRTFEASPGRGAQHRGPGRGSPPSPGWPTPGRAGPTGRPSRPRRSRPRWWSSAAGPSGSSWPRSSRRFGTEVTVARGGPAPDGARGARGRATCWPRSSPTRASTCGPASPSPSVRRTTGSRFAVRLGRARRRWWPTACWWRPAGAPTCQGLGLATIGLDEARHGHPGGRPPPGAGRGGLGDRRRHRQGRLHPRLDVPGRHRRERHPGQPGDPRRLPGGAPGHLHRPRDRLGGAERGAAREQGLEMRVGFGRDPRRRPGAGSTRRATAASSSWSRTPDRGCWSGPPRPGRPAARSSRCSPWPSTPRCPPTRLRHMIYAYPTFHRADRGGGEGPVGVVAVVTAAAAAAPGGGWSAVRVGWFSSRGGRGSAGTRRPRRSTPRRPRTRTRPARPRAPRG